MNSINPDPLLDRRDLFPILASTNYLISNSLGAVPESASAALQEYYQTWAERGVRAWEETWWTLANDLGDLIAPLIGAQANEVVFQPNVTLAHAVVFSAFDFKQGRNKVVTDAMHFPSILYLIEGLKELGAEVVVVPSDDGLTVSTEGWIDAIDERTAFVNFSHVLFKSSYVQDVKSIGGKARDVGAFSIVDGYQSVGSIPVDVRGLGVDAYIGGCLKWLCGGPGTAFSWVRPELVETLRPRLTGWMSHQRPFGFEPTLDRRDDAWRFLHGTPNIPALYAARPGLEIINEVGIDAIRAKSTRQTSLLLSLAEGQGFRCSTPKRPEDRGGTVAIDIDHGYEISKTLKAANILCDYRPGAGIRLSPHFYNSDHEVETAIEAIAQIQRDGSWKAFLDHKSTVT